MKKKQVIITGGTGGLGKAVTKLCLEKGASVTIPFKYETELSALESETAKSVNFVRTDLLLENEVEIFFSNLEKVHVLIHLVGGFSMGKTEEFSVDQWKHQVDLNLTSAFLVCKYGLPLMQKNDYGRIVTIGSRAAVEPAAEMAAYCASKAGVIALTRSIAEETKGTGITANCVLPSIIDTAANRAAMGASQAAGWVSPESLAEVICFLASRAAADLRGSVLPVYGNT